jgi:hypothetical protein
MRSLTAALLLGASLAAGACAAGTSGRLYVRTGPPPLRTEAVLVSPGPQYVWVPGYYRYDGRAYVWVAGQYERPPRPRARWATGHWQQDRRGWFWVDGHWR